MGLTYTISKLDFLEHFLLVFTDFKLLVFHNNTVKISENMNKYNFLKTCIKTNHLAEFFIICSHFYYGENGNFHFFLWNLWTE